MKKKSKMSLFYQSSQVQDYFDRIRIISEKDGVWYIDFLWLNSDESASLDFCRSCFCVRGGFSTRSAALEAMLEYDSTLNYPKADFLGFI
jgi:hypothetical protein